MTDLKTKLTSMIGFVAQSPEIFGHDLDGNVTNDGRWTFTWDAENRLVSMVSLTNSPADSKRRLTFGYDYQGRRITKAVESWTGSGWTMTASNKFGYEGWNLLAELNATNNAVIRSYVWGLDLSGSLQGAGGVGGLLAVTDAVNGTHFFAHDGNGNVSALVNASDGTVSALYEYGPFGETTRATGLMAANNPFRFSTKYQDNESDQIYYGYRFYSGSAGRWLSRDPIGEHDGPNVYAFVHNTPPNLIDRNGRESWGLYFDRNGNWAYPWGLPKPPSVPPAPYYTEKDTSGLKFVKVSKCNVVVFYGHGFADTLSDGTPVDWKKVTTDQLNQSDVPSTVKNAPCSSAEVFGCNTGYYVNVENPTAGSVNPKGSVWGNLTKDIDALWARARAQAKAICQKKDTCCDSVTITFEYREPWYQRPSYVTFNSRQMEVVKCK